MKKVILLLTLFSVAVFAQQKGSFTDSRDGKTYKTVKIGSQIWMAENLNVKIDGSVCYESKEENCRKYGRLYNRGIAMKACPKGWHLPSYNDWQMLFYYVGGKKIAGTKLKAKSSWNEDGNGTDDYGFSALPGGGYSHDGDYEGENIKKFYSVGRNGYWWADHCYCACSSYMFHNSGEVMWEETCHDYGAENSIRCIESKCGGKPYNPKMQFCYTDKIYDNCGDILGAYYGNYENGGEAYNPEKQFCYLNKVYDKCGDIPYNPEMQFCRTSDNTTHTCDNKPYNPDSEFCHTNNKAYMKCDEPYNPETHFCYYNINPEKKILKSGKACDIEKLKAKMVKAQVLFDECAKTAKDNSDRIKCWEILYECADTDNKIYNKVESDVKPKCDNISYNSETQFCHFNIIYNKCGNLPYNPEKQFCYTDKIYNKCDNKPYNPEAQVCQANKVYLKCGDKPYDPATHYCRATDGTTHTCGNKPYVPEVQICANNKIYNKCGDKQYNPETHFCHYDNKIYDKCGSQPYIPKMQVCTNNKIYNKCGDKQYNPETHFCHYDNKIYNKCGNKPYNPNIQVCHTDNKIYLGCSNKPYNPETHYCRTSDGTTHTCDNKPYNPDIQVCHTDNKIYPKCGDKMYNQETHYCRTLDGTTHTCGNKPYNPEVQICHTDNKAYLRCGNKPYNYETHFCRTTDGTTHTCGNKPYNPATQSCCGNQPYIHQMQFCHTDNTVKTCDTEKIRTKQQKAQTFYIECLKTSDSKKCATDYMAKLQEPCGS